MANIFGTANNDVLFGSIFDDYLAGYAGDDEIVAGDGNDIVFGGLGSDRIVGGAGNDQLIGEEGNDNIFGEDGNDALIGGMGSDQLSGGNGDDYLEGDAGDDDLSGDAGNDSLYAGTGTDYLFGGSGNDILSGEEGNDTLYGNSDNDSLFGGDGDDFMDGGDGNDVLYGGRNNDYMYGGSGDDFLNGERGVDTMAGEGGNDTYVVDNVGDQIVDEEITDGFDTVRSTVTYTLVDNLEYLSLEGSLNINGTGNSQANLLQGNAGSNNLSGGAGIDTFLGSNGNDTINGGTEFDRADYSNLNQAITLKPQGFLEKGTLGTDSLAGIEAIIGRAGLANTIDASTNPSTVSITANLLGNQLSVNGVPGITSPFNVVNFVNAFGGAANDIFVGNVENNNFVGNGGNDTFFGSGGSDTLNGGIGTDVANYSTLGQAITIRPQGVLAKGTLGTDILVGIETIIGQAGLANSIDASSNPSSITINANLVANSLTVNNVPGVGNLSFNVANFINVTGGAGNDTIFGGNDNNNLIGNLGNDFFGGSFGNDTINGGIGSDTVDYSNFGQAITIKPQGIVDKGTFGTDSLIGIETIIGKAGMSNSIDVSNNPSSVSIYANLAGNSLSVNGVPAIGQLNFTVQNFVNITAGAGSDYIAGDANNNILIGNAGNDTIDAGNGNDTLSGGAGLDYLYGGYGDDVYSIEDAFDFAIEGFNGGNDTVNSQVSYILTYGVETLSLQGSTNIDGTGNSGDNTILGNSGNNILRGGGGQDTLFGLVGDDSLYANSTATSMFGGSGVDNFYITGRPIIGALHTIGDFSAGEKVFLVGVAGATQFSNLAFAVTGADTTLSVSGQAITKFTNIAPSQLTASNFVFA